MFPTVWPLNGDRWQHLVAIVGYAKISERDYAKSQGAGRDAATACNSARDREAPSRVQERAGEDFFVTSGLTGVEEARKTWPSLHDSLYSPGNEFHR